MSSYYSADPLDGPSLRKLRDREIVVLFLAVFAGIILPLIILLGSLLVSAWLDIVGFHGIHATIWGWLSDHAIDKKGNDVWTVSDRVWQFYIGIVSVWLIYQFCELCWAGFSTFKEALSGKA